MENIQNNPPAEGNGVSTVLLTIVILAILALGAWWFLGRRASPGVPATGTDDKSSVNVDLNATVPSGSGTNDGPAGGSTGNQNGS